MRQDHLIFTIKNNQPKRDDPPPTVLERDTLVKPAIQQRCDDLANRIKQECEVRDYLVSQDKPNAAKRVQRDIDSLTQLLESYKKDL